MAVINEAVGMEWMRLPREHVTVKRGDLRHIGVLAVEPVKEIKGVWSEVGGKTEEWYGRSQGRKAFQAKPNWWYEVQVEGIMNRRGRR